MTDDVADDDTAPEPNEHDLCWCDEPELIVDAAEPEHAVGCGRCGGWMHPERLMINGVQPDDRIGRQIQIGQRPTSGQLVVI